jgi:tetratricopeptide (TPR) repeat protein
MPFFKRHILLFVAFLALNGLIYSGTQTYHNASAINFEVYAKQTLDNCSDKYLVRYPDSAIICAQKVLAIALDSNNVYWQGKAHHITGTAYLTKARYHLALPHLQNGLKAFTRINDSDGISDSHSSIGYCFYQLSSYANSIRYINKSIELDKKTNDTSGLARNYNNLGLVFKAEKEYDLANEYYQKTLAISLQLNAQRYVLVCHNNIGNIFLLQGKYKEALKSFNKCRELLKGREHTPNYGRIIGNIASAQIELREYKKALNNLHKAKQLFVAINLQADLTTTYESLSNLHLELHNSDSAIYYGQLAYELANSARLLKRIESSAEQLAKAFREQENFARAYDMKIVENSIGDSLTSQNIISEIADIIVTNQIEQEEYVQFQKEIQANKLILEKKTRRDTLELSGISIGLILFFGFLLLLVKYNVSNWVVELSVFIFILIVFEFILVLTDPYVDVLAQEEPLKKLLINAGIGGGLFPLHIFLESRFKRRIVAKKDNYKLTNRV